jgi:hypothetical protein
LGRSFSRFFELCAVPFLALATLRSSFSAPIRRRVFPFSFIRRVPTAFVSSLKRAENFVPGKRKKFEKI